MNKRSVFFLSILLLLSGCAAHKVNVPALEFGGTEGDVSVLRLYFDGDSPVFLENGFTDLSALYVTGQYRHVFDLEVLEMTDTETIYELPRSYDPLDNVTGILIYSDYAYAAVREDSNLRLPSAFPRCAGENLGGFLHRRAELCQNALRAFGCGKLRVRLNLT